MELDFSTDQLEAIESIKQFLDKSSKEKTLLFQGSAGTGKTSVINHIFNLSKYKEWRICLAATTNKAVAVMQQMNSSKRDTLEFSTLHKLLKTKRVIDVNGDAQFVVNQNAIFGKKTKKSGNPETKNINSYNVIVIDEASMISSSLFNSLMEVIHKVKGKIIFTGDRMQLNPVNEDESDVFKLSNSIELTTIHRAKNGILGISNHIRESVEKRDKIKIKKWCDDNVILIKNRDEWFNKFLEMNESNLEPIVLAYTNQCCNEINSKIRKMVFKDTKDLENHRFLKNDRIVFNNGYTPEMNQETSSGEELQSIKRYHTSEQSTIKSIETSVSTTKPLDYQDLVCPDSPTKNTFGKLCHICYKFPINYQIEVSCLHKFCNECYLNWIHITKECPKCSFYEKNGEFIVANRFYKALAPLLNKFLRFTVNSYKVYHITLEDGCSIHVLHEKSFEKFKRDSEMIKSIIENVKSISKSSFIHTISRHLWEYYYKEFVDKYADISYGYCITSHKSQGSTYNTVFVDIGNILNYNRSVVDGLKCIYTSVTRPSQNLIMTY